MEDFDSVVGDSSFLNALQKDVAKWIKEIQKVSIITVREDSRTFVVMQLNLLLAVIWICADSVSDNSRTFSDQFCYLTGQFYTCAVMMSAHYIIKALASSANYNLLSSLALSIVRLRANCLHNCANCISARRLN